MEFPYENQKFTCSNFTETNKVNRLTQREKALNEIYLILYNRVKRIESKNENFDSTEFFSKYICSSKLMKIKHNSSKNFLYYYLKSTFRLRKDYK